MADQPVRSRYELLSDLHFYVWSWFYSSQISRDAAYVQMQLLITEIRNFDNERKFRQ